MKYGFQFHAFGTGVAGRITHPFAHTIESLAPCALAPQGGYSSGRVNNYRLREVISFRAAYTQVSGAFSEETQSWDTLMTSTVEGLDVLGALKADLIVARLASRHPVGSIEPSILPLGSRIEGLQIAGIDVQVELNSDRYSALDTYSKIAAAYRDDEDFRKEFEAANYVGKKDELPEQHRRYFPWSSREPQKEIPNFGGLLSTSLVRQLIHSSSAIETYGHIIYVPQFGTASFGSLTIDGKARRLTMISLDLGCAACGNVSAGSGETNGQPMPPPVSHGT